MADPDESLSVAAGLRFHAVPIWGAASAFLPGADPIPESGGDEAADLRRDSRADRHGLSGPYPRILARECEDFATLSLPSRLMRRCSPGKESKHGEVWSGWGHHRKSCYLALLDSHAPTCAPDR